MALSLKQGDQEAEEMKLQWRQQATRKEKLQLLPPGHMGERGDQGARSAGSPPQSCGPPQTVIISVLKVYFPVHAGAAALSPLPKTK